MTCRIRFTNTLHKHISDLQLIQEPQCGNAETFAADPAVYAFMEFLKMQKIRRWIFKSDALTDLPVFATHTLLLIVLIFNAEKALLCAIWDSTSCDILSHFVNLADCFLYPHLPEFEN